MCVSSISHPIPYVIITRSIINLITCCQAMAMMDETHRHPIFRPHRRAIGRVFWSCYRLINRVLTGLSCIGNLCKYFGLPYFICGMPCNVCIKTIRLLVLKDKVKSGVFIGRSFKIVHIAEQWQMKNMHWIWTHKRHFMKSQKTHHSSPSGASYGVSLLSVFGENLPCYNRIAMYDHNPAIAWHVAALFCQGTDVEKFAL